VCALQKNALLTKDFCLVSSLNIQTFLNQESFTSELKWQEMIFALTLKFLLKTSIIICQWGKKNNPVLHLN